MKTLGQVEPRADLQATPLPAGVTTDANYHFIINQPGSYYLSANLGVTKPNGIQIAAEGVTLDLSGFRISRGSGTGGIAIHGPAGSHRATIRNGTITGFATGITAGASGNSLDGWSFEDLRVSQCAELAIFTGAGAVVNSCRVAFSRKGIETGPAATITNSTAWYTELAGFDLDSASTIQNCTAYRCGTGIIASLASTVTNCSAMYSENSGIHASGVVSNCAADYNGSNGISADFNTTIKDCRANLNTGSGIRVFQACQVIGNTATRNGEGDGSGAGIHVTGRANRIESNHVSENDRGIDVDEQRNLIVRNSARSNGANYTIVAGNRIAQIVVPALNGAAITDANSGSSDGFTNVDPWANFSF